MYPGAGGHRVLGDGHGDIRVRPGHVPEPGCLLAGSRLPGRRLGRRVPGQVVAVGSTSISIVKAAELLADGREKAVVSHSGLRPRSQWIPQPIAGIRRRQHGLPTHPVNAAPVVPGERGPEVPQPLSVELLLGVGEVVRLAVIDHSDVTSRAVVVGG